MPDENPLADSRYMGGARAQIPLRITPEFIACATYHIDRIDANLGYQAAQRHRAAHRWARAGNDGEYVWMTVAGAATPTGFGGLFADLIANGNVDAIISTGANVYHDLHFACGLPVRHGHHQVDDNDLLEDGTTRIYDRNISNPYTLGSQDRIVQVLGRRVAPRLQPPFSSAKLVYEIGKELLEDKTGLVVDRKGSFVVRAAEFGVPVYLDSGSNHSLGMGLSALRYEGLNLDSSPSEDDIETAALAFHMEPHLFVFLGEGGPRNLGQTSAPTVSEIFFIPYKGAGGCIRFTVADVRAGALSGSDEAEAVTWKKYPTADPRREIVPWAEYTLTFPDVAGYVVGQGLLPHRRLFDQLPEIRAAFDELVRQNEPRRKEEQKRLERLLPFIQKHEVDARKAAGYLFEGD